VPLPGRERLAGWLALGPRSSGGPFSRHDLGYLDALCDHASIAVERAQVVADLERRVREMNVLIRVAQGVNVTLAFDDILELIYAQTVQVIPSGCMRVTLRDQINETLYHAFFIEEGERLGESENRPISSGQGLEGEVIRSQRSLLTSDYERECRTRGLLPAAQGLFAWAGVPLNAGAETIGAISLASRDPAVVYTQEQCNLLQAIADQTAGAIVKARLLQETEHRARQLITLNEVGRSLTSTLEIKPLLNQILQSAAEILNCEAGSLFLVDETSAELIFEVTVGPVAGNLAGQRLPPGTGLVGKAVEAGQPLIANNARRAQGWFDEADKQTGFVTRDLLVVPMQVKDRIIGVIEVINKSDGSPFLQDDQNLLSTFASQAAVAVENARLYTQTDEALAARVEELSVMQRIDRELNASLDVSRAMHITLDWAMRQSSADAGLIGILREAELKDSSPSSAGLSVMASRGYPQFYGMGSGEDDHTGLLLDLPALLEAIQSGQPQVRPEFAGGTQGVKDGSYPSRDCLLENASGQFVIPIRREAIVIGLLLLESRQPEFGRQDETLAFLSRLSDHAAIAISNAQLYAAVQEANRAKSEFVSFVSHELKTPMTSIKGYADLLAVGSVGPVNELQANFLNTIRSNVNRMATLVSDLADISRIESGRLRLEFHTVNLSEIIEEAVRSNKAQIDAKGQELSLQLPGELPRVWGDQTRLIQVLTNLVSNANKYTPSGGQITISADHPGGQTEAGAPDCIHVAVQDTGFGISADDQKKIFTKFFRSEDQNIREAPGTGLGLNITRYMVEMQGGRIWFESELGKGTIFHFTVPLAPTKV
jgi:signal transduction histidine kinase